MNTELQNKITDALLQVEKQKMQTIIDIIEEKEGIKINPQDENERKFKRIMVIENQDDGSQDVFFNDGSKEGLFICTFTKIDIEISEDGIKITQKIK